MSASINGTGPEAGPRPLIKISMLNSIATPPPEGQAQWRPVPVTQLSMVISRRRRGTEGEKGGFERRGWGGGGGGKESDRSGLGEKKRGKKKRGVGRGAVRGGVERKRGW